MSVFQVSLNSVFRYSAIILAGDYLFLLSEMSHFLPLTITLINDLRCVEIAFCFEVDRETYELGH